MLTKCNFHESLFQNYPSKSVKSFLGNTMLKTTEWPDRYEVEIVSLDCEFKGNNKNMKEKQNLFRTLIRRAHPTVDK